MLPSALTETWKPPATTLRYSDVTRYWFPGNRALRRGAVAGWRLRVLSPLKGLLGRFKTGASASTFGWAPALATPKASYPGIGKMSLYGTGKHGAYCRRRITQGLQMKSNLGALPVRQATLVTVAAFVFGFCMVYSLMLKAGSWPVLEVPDINGQEPALIILKKHGLGF